MASIVAQAFLRDVTSTAGATVIPLTVPAGTNLVLVVLQAANTNSTSPSNTCSWGATAMADLASHAEVGSFHCAGWILPLGSPSASVTDNVSITFPDVFTVGNFMVLVLDDINQTTPLVDFNGTFLTSYLLTNVSPLTIAAGNLAVSAYAGAFSGCAVDGSTTALHLNDLLVDTGSAQKSAFVYRVGGKPGVTFATNVSPGLAPLHLQFAAATAPDSTSPTLLSPTGTATGSTTATGSVSTNESTGTLYRLASTNATETLATVKAAALTQAVSASGVQAVTFTGLTPATPYFAHYVHPDGAGNDSAVANSGSFTTSVGAATETTLSVPPGGQVGVPSAAITAGLNGTGTSTLTPSDSGAGGTFSPAGAQTVTYPTQASWTYTPASIGNKPISVSNSTGLTAAAAQNYLAAATAGTLTIAGLRNGSGTLLASTTLPNVVVIQRSNRAALLALTAQATNGAGALVISSGVLAAGVACMVLAFSDDGTAAGAWPATVV